jgi:DNA (cytosine-5)-methyltransferase 1
VRYLSVCSGIEAATVAWHPLGWTPVGFSEIEAFPSAVLAHHYPNIPNYGDMTQHEQWNVRPGSVDLLVGGTPCQSFSVAGLRKGLKDPRGGLMLTYLEIAQRLRPRWVVWENVPGVLSSNGGRDFGSFLGALGELGYGWAYRVLDAQWCRTHRHPRAVPQRRRRVFVVGRLIERGVGDSTAAAAVLFERESVRRDTAARRATRQGSASDAEGGAGAGCYWNGEQIAAALTRKGCDDRMPDKERLFAVLQPVAGTLGTRGVKSHTELDGHGAYIPVPYDLYQITAPINRQNRQPGDPCHTLARDNAAHAAIAIQGNLVGRDTGGPQGVGASEEGAMYTLTKADTHAVAFTAGNLARGAGASPNADVSQTLQSQHGRGSTDQHPCVAHVAPSLTATNDPSRSPQSAEVTQQVAAVHAATMTVRRLTPRECERLQGFPDSWTEIPWRGKPASECPDGPRYRALGNSMAVNCMAWIGERIAAQEAQ